MICRIAYASIPRADLAACDVPRIITRARASNERDGIGGTLVFTGAAFVQLIEGPAEAVEALWRRIQDDARHHSLKLFLDMTDDAAWFPEWRVGYLYDEDFVRSIASWRARTDPMNDEERRELRRRFAAADAC